MYCNDGHNNQNANRIYCHANISLSNNVYLNFLMITVLNTKHRVLINITANILIDILYRLFNLSVENILRVSFKFVNY